MTSHNKLFMDSLPQGTYFTQVCTPWVRKNYAII